MAYKAPGTKAPYRFKDECTWVTGKDAGELSSTGYGSCVGLVLYGPRHRIGVVAHYSGSLGTKKFIHTVEPDTLEILRDVCPLLPGIWKAWVFGGKSLEKHSQIATKTIDSTKALIDEVRRVLKGNKYIPINMLPNHPEFKEPEMTTAYVGHDSVKLDLASGTVIWGF